MNLQKVKKTTLLHHITSHNGSCQIDNVIDQMDHIIVAHVNVNNCIFNM